MLRLPIVLLLALSAAACARNPAVTVVTETRQFPDSAPRADRNEAARSTGRAAGAGGSHAPGGTGLGAGTLGADRAAESGSAR